MVGCGGDEHAPAGHSWSYRGANGPRNWPELSKEYAVCESGKMQSPINLTGAVAGDAPALEFEYRNTDAVEIEHQHIAAHVRYEPGNLLRVGEREYTLLQFHIHVESEHTIDGERFAMEMHHVHQAADGELAVVGGLYQLGASDPAIERLIQATPALGETSSSDLGLPAVDFMPAYEDGCYRYPGSLTTPPCSEGVQWFVARRLRTISQDQMERLRDLNGGPNFRPVQPLNGRQILLTPH